MKVYHGTNVAFDRIDLKKCNPDNDFGQGFYVTAIEQHAIQRAADITDRFGGEPVVMEFDFDEYCLQDSNFQTLVFEKPSREWVEFVMHNRDRKANKPTHHFDIVAGPIADDRMRRQFDRYEMKEITMEQLLDKITYREPTHQIMLGTAKAIALIQIDNDFNQKIEEAITAMGVALVTDLKMDVIEAMNNIYNSNVFMRLTDNSTGLYQQPWQDIYEMLKRELT